MRPSKDPDVEATVELIPTDQGGRKTAALSGYRPYHLVKPDYLTSGHHEYKEVDELHPGESAETEIWFITPHAYPHTLSESDVINIQEGSRVVGYATIRRVLNPKLQREI